MQIVNLRVTTRSLGAVRVCVCSGKKFQVRAAKLFLHMADSSAAGKMIFHRAAEEWRLMKKVANKERSQAIKNWCWAAAAFYRQCMRPGEM